MTMLPPSKDIDLARVGLSKSLMMARCQRAGLYDEMVRDANGRRIRLMPDEKMLFGTAVDEAVGYIAWHQREKREWSLTKAFDTAMVRVREQETAEPTNWDVFELQFSNALSLFRDSLMGPDRVGPLSAFEWLQRHVEEPEFRIQGDDGRSLKADDIIGTPDFVCRHVIDVKAMGRKIGQERFMGEPEMPIYSLLYAEEHGGALPEYVGYLAYIRTVKPYWMAITEPATSEMVALGRIHAAHWRAATAARNPDLMAFDTKWCKGCRFAKPIPEADFAGCPIGALMPEIEEAA